MTFKIDQSKLDKLKYGFKFMEEDRFRGGTHNKNQINKDAITKS